MADFSALKTSIQNYIKQNGNEEITGNLLQQILLSMVTTLGDSAINDLVTALNAEVATRGNADTELGGRITTLQGVVNGIKANVENGYVYAGIATPSTTPASGKVFYLALTAGTYTNFGATVVPQGINILKYNGTAWSLDNFLGLDDAPTQGSGNLVKSGGVFSSIGDISAGRNVISTRKAILRNHNWEKVSEENEFYLYPEATCDAFAFPIYLNDITKIEVLKSDGTPQNTVFKVIYDNNSGVGNPRNISSIIKYRQLNYSIVKVYMYWVNTQGDQSYCENPEDLNIVVYRKNREINIGIRDLDTLNFEYSNKDSDNAVTVLSYNRNNSLYFSDNFGISYTFTLSAGTFNIGHLTKLIHNIRTNITEVKPIGYICNDYEVVLTYCYSGYLYGGILALENYYLNKEEIPEIQKKISNISSLTEFLWEQGLWDANGNLQDRTNRIRFPYLVQGNIVNVTKISSGNVYACWYNSEKQCIGYSDIHSIGILNNASASYFRVGFGIDDVTPIQPSILNTIDLEIFSPTYSPISVYQEKIKDIDDRIYNIENISEIDKYIHLKSIPYCVVNDRFSQTSGSAPHLQIDESTGLCFVSYLTSHTEYGETHGLSGLSIFPASQPFKAENYIFAETGDLDFNGNPLDGAPFETNCLVYRNSDNKLKCRCFFNCANQKLYYRDFDYETRTFDFAAKIVQYNGNDMTRDEMSQIVQDAGYDAWGTGNGIIFTSNLYKNYSDGYIYACIEGTTGNPIVIKSNDNFATCLFVGILPEKVWYECQICELNGTFYILYRQPAITMQTTTDFENYSTKVTLSDYDQRPQCLSYNNNIWLFIPRRISYNGTRQCYEIYKGTGLDISAYTKVATLEDEFGVVYMSGSFLNGRLAISFCTSPFMFTNEGKDDVVYYVLPNVYEGIKPISIN